jgi:acetyltransferase-like isoleucine patch superfamily enzyme
VIGANAVVAGEVPEYEIWAGVPARKIGERS